jgi:hypothetical protein
MASGAAAQQQSLGIFGLWGAFAGNGRCHAISQPERAAQGGARGAFASVAFWPQRGLRGQAYFRLSQPKREGSALILRIDERTFQLRGGGVQAWAPDATADAAIVAAMRTGILMTLDTRSASGSLVRDSYRLRGAATAIDAAAIACARRG